MTFVSHNFILVTTLYIKEASFQINMEQTFLSDNQITVYTYPNENLHSFCIALYVKAGCLYESDTENGITHFLEHIAFRSVNCQMNHHLYQILDRCGLAFDASTYREFVQFTISGAPSHFETAADIITKVLYPPVLSDQDVRLERERIKAEIREYDEKSTLDYFSNRIVWKNTSLARTITGKKKVLNSIETNELILAHENTFTRENMFFYLTGAVTDSHVRFLLSLIGACSIRSSNCQRENIAPVPADFFKRSHAVYRKKGKPYSVRFSFDIDTSKYSGAELDLLYDIVFSGHSGAVYQELSEKRGLIYSHDAGFEQYTNIGSFYFSFEVRPQALIQAVDIMIQRLKGLKTSITDELECARAAYVDNSYIMLDDAEELNWQFAYENHILNYGYKNMEERIAAYSCITADRLTEIAGEIFRPSNMVLTVKGKKKHISVSDLQKLVQSL